MNPITSMLAEAQLAASVVPTLFRIGGSIAAHLPDIEARFADLVEGLRKAAEAVRHLDFDSAEAELGAAWKNGMAVYADVGIPRGTVQAIVAATAKDVPALSGLESAIAAGESIARRLGLPV